MENFRTCPIAVPPDRPNHLKGPYFALRPQTPGILTKNKVSSLPSQSCKSCHPVQSAPAPSRRKLPKHQKVTSEKFTYLPDPSRAPPLEAPWRGLTSLQSSAILYAT